jgi:hypothetical protein
MYGDMKENCWCIAGNFDINILFCDIFELLKIDKYSTGMFYNRLYFIFLK